MERDKINREFILITSSNFPVGGAGANYLNLFCRGLKLNGCSIRVLLLKGFAFGNCINDDSRKNVTDNGVPYTYLGFIRRPKISFLKLFDDILSFLRLIYFLFSILHKRRSICLLIYNDEVQSNIPIHLFSRLFGIRRITFIPEFYDRSNFRGSVFQKIKWYGFILNYYYLNKYSDKLIVFSYFLKDEYVNQGFNIKNIMVQPNLIDFGFWETKTSDIKYDIGYSGTPSIKDGLYDLFKAVSILQGENIHISLSVIGDSTFGPSLIPELKNECRKLGILDNVNFTGLVESAIVRVHLSECRLLAITRPSTIQTKAGFPTKLGEYFAAKKPIIATNFGDINKYFEDGVDLVIAESGNPESIAIKIKWMIENRGISELIAEKGYHKAKELFDCDKSVIKLIQFININ